MILTLTDGAETVFLALILRSVQEERPLAEVLSDYIGRDRLPEFLAEIRSFAKTKLNRFEFKRIFEEMDQYLESAYEAEKKGRYQRK